jgi:AbrB family looped-hinge helix DNA binding protein
MKNHYSKITSKGQITVPIHVRNKMNLSTGTKLELIQEYLVIGVRKRSLSRISE